jgi:hypothetical protein
MKWIALSLFAVVMVAGSAGVTCSEAKPASQSAKTVHGVRPEGGAMPAQIANLFLLDDLENGSRTRDLAKSDLNALHSIASWINSFVVRPHKDLGRDGTVCPFVPGALERKTLWLAPERVGDRSVLDVVQLMNGYKKLLLDVQPMDGNGTQYKSIVVVFTDLSPARAKVLFADVLQHLAVPSYVDDGLVLGGFYEGNEGSAIYNHNLRPFTSPVPFLLVRHAVISDWKFYLDNDEWLNRWAHRYGESAVQALAEQLRRLPWREPAATSAGTR